MSGQTVRAYFTGLAAAVRAREMQSLHSSGPVVDSCFRCDGKVTRIAGMQIEATGLAVPPGVLCQILGKNTVVTAEVTAFSGEVAILLAHHALEGITPGSPVRPLHSLESIAVDRRLKGRVIDSTGNPLDGGAVLATTERWPLHSAISNPLQKEKITEAFDVGIRAINGLLTVGKGQRLGIFAGSGVGKSVLLGMMTRLCRADVTVIGLIGERGREVREFIEDSLGQEGLQRATVVASAADTSPLLRARGAVAATAIAEYFRSLGNDVLLIIDSVTRYAQALREISASTGELPAARGFAPSVFSALSRLVERAGNGERGQGSITAFYTVLLEGNDRDDPIADHMRSVLDGHIFLSRELAGAGHYPAIDLLDSCSRIMCRVADKNHMAAAGLFRKMHAEYLAHREMILMGMYRSGTNPLLDCAIRLHPQMEKFCQQGRSDYHDLAGSISQLQQLLAVQEV